jgi:hypothetical protein
VPRDKSNLCGRQNPVKGNTDVDYVLLEAAKNQRVRSLAEADATHKV